MRDKRFLWELCYKGKPLAEVHVLPREGVDIQRLIDALNALGPDVAAGEGVYNSMIRDGKLPGHRPSADMDATKEALDRLFGWRLKRSPLPKVNSTTREIEGYWDNAYYWEEVEPAQRIPLELDGMFESMGLSQPGANDDGQDDTIEYMLPEGAG